MGCVLKLLAPSGGALALITLGSIALLTGCARNASSDHQVYAKVDGQPIFREDVERIYRGRATAGSGTRSPEQSLSVKLSILDELIDKQILLDHASRSRITVSEAEVDTKIGELQSPYSKEEFLRKLREQGVDPGGLRRELRQTLIINRLINNEINSHISITNAEITAYYARNKASFNVPETEYHLAQIEVTPQTDAEVRNLKNDDANNLVAAERKVRALYARLRAGEDFSKVAQEYSEDPKTAVAGGDMGFIPASSLNANQTLRQAVSSLRVGQMSGIVRTATGFHILKLLGKEDPGQRLLSDPEVQGEIRQTLRNEKQQVFKAAYIEVLRNRAKVVNYLAEEIVGGSTRSPAGQ